MRFSVDALPGKFQAKIAVRQVRAGFTPCWCWIGRLNRNGYARGWWNGREPVLHRVTFELLRGPIPAGLILDHECRNRACINPEHAEPVTHQVNTLRGNAILFRPKEPAYAQ